MHRVKIRMKADVVAFERGDDILPPPPFEHPGFLTYHLECGTDVALGEHLGQALASIVISR